ncbi:MAG TPA: DUF4835 family protein [Salinimicrobium sp.]|nr:DUF4835 family protein [Salinimicrobium sp.]
MSKFFSLLVLLMVSTSLFAQELNCEVIVNADQTGNPNLSIFRTLENSLTEFINQTNWSDKELQSIEKIDCSMFINITEYTGNTFTGTIQVQSSRPVYGSTMISPVFNFRDQQLSFNYIEYQPLEFNANVYNSNLVSIISFYVYTILGLDADTFEERGGTEFFEVANQIVSTAQAGGKKGWQASGNSGSRFELNSNLLSNSFVEFREAMYNYHRMGLDVMHRSPQEGKESIAEAILTLSQMNSRRPNSLLVRTFFDAKSNEIQQVFSGGPSVPVREVIEALNNLAPTFAGKWNTIGP